MPLPWQTVLRALLKFGGGYFVSRGLTNDDTLETIVSGIIAVIGLIWGWMEKRAHQRMIEQLAAQINRSAGATDSLASRKSPAP